eukprot:469335-Amorphochlora_amoeboformis.AAC.3
MRMFRVYKKEIGCGGREEGSDSIGTARGGVVLLRLYRGFSGSDEQSRDWPIQICGYYWISNIRFDIMHMAYPDIANRYLNTQPGHKMIHNSGFTAILPNYILPKNSKDSLI